MVWSTTTAVGEFLAEAGEFLRAEPARNSIILTVTENLRVQAAAPPPSPPFPPGVPTPHASSGADRTLLGWWRPDAGAGPISGAFLSTPCDAGVREVVLYTDLANPTSNALYQRLGYRPVTDRLVLSC